MGIMIYLVTFLLAVTKASDSGSLSDPPTPSISTVSGSSMAETIHSQSGGSSRWSDAPGEWELPCGGDLCRFERELQDLENNYVHFQNKYKLKPMDMDVLGLICNTYRMNPREARKCLTELAENSLEDCRRGILHGWHHVSGPVTRWVVNNILRKKCRGNAFQKAFQYY